MTRITIILTLIILTSSCNHSETEKLIKEKERLSLRVDSLGFKLDSLSKLPSLNFQTALEIEDYKQQEAKEFYKSIIESDSNSFWANQAKERLTFLISKDNKESFINQLLGTWNWKETYTNWGEINSPSKCQCKQELKFIEGNVAEFYRNDSLQRKTEIEIASNPDMFGGRLIKLIKFKDSNEIRQLYLSENTKELTFTEPDCVCGCVTDTYIKKNKNRR